MAQEMVKGSCLCGAITFSIKGALPNAYQCHCSLCRKVTGANANAATLVTNEQFSWDNTTDVEQIAHFSKPTGYRSDFCKVCGSPVPNAIGNGDLYWIPLGLITTPVNIKVVQHLHLASKAQWDVIAFEDDVEETTSAQQLYALLK